MQNKDNLTVTSLSAKLLLFWEGALLSYRALFRWIRPSVYLASKILMPLAQMIFFTFIGIFAGSTPPEFYILGNALHVAAVSGIYGVSFSIAGDRWEGTLIYLFASPSNRLILFSGRALMHLIDGVFGVFIGFLGAISLLGLRFAPSSIPAMLVIVSAVVYSTASMGLLMGCIGLITRNVMFVNNTVYFLLLLLSGANVKLASLPTWMRGIGSMLPITHGLAALRHQLAVGKATELRPGLSAITGYLPGKEVLTLILLELLVGTAWLLIAYLAFHHFELRSKKIGSLETM